MNPLRVTARKRAAPELKDAHIRRVLDTAKRLLTEAGSLEKLTIRGLAAASEVAPATLYNRFVDKETLISIVVTDHFEQHVRHGFVERKAGTTPLEAFVNGLKRMARTCHEQPALTKTLVDIYYRLSSKRGLTQVMYGALHNTVRTLLGQMREENVLEEWASLDAICAEICDRTFSVIHRWALGDIPDRNLIEHLEYGSLVILLGVSRRAQADTIGKHIKEVQGRKGFVARLRPKPGAVTA